MNTDLESEITRLEHQIRYLEDQRALLHEQMAPLQNKYRQAAERIDALHEQRDALKCQVMQQSGLTDWNWLLEYMPETEARMQGCRTALGHFGLGLGRYHHETNQAVPQIRLVKDDRESLARHLAGLETLLPYLKPMESGSIELPILGNENVGRGTWELKIKPEERLYLVTAHPLYRQRDHAFATLEAALVYIQENLFWQVAE